MLKDNELKTNTEYFVKIGNKPRLHRLTFEMATPHIFCFWNGRYNEYYERNDVDIIAAVKES